MPTRHGEIVKHLVVESKGFLDFVEVFAIPWRQDLVVVASQQVWGPSAGLVGCTSQAPQNPAESTLTSSGSS